MKIAMVSMNAGPLARLGGVHGGGQSVAVDGLADALAQAGHQVTISTQRDDPTLPACLTTGSGVHIHHLESDLDAFAAGLAAAWEADRPDVVHAHAWISGKAALPVAARLGVPVVQTFHGLGHVGERRATAGGGAGRLEAEVALVAGCARIIASSSAEVFELLGLGASPGSIKLIPCGVDLRLFRPAPPPRLPARPGFRIATLCRLAGDAGVGDVIEALSLVPEVELVVGGGRTGGVAVTADPDVAELERLARVRGLGRRVTFAGRIARGEAPLFLRAADAVICVPQRDSTGAVALEAMACGVPVIVSAVGALVDIVADGMTGIQVPPGAPRQLAYAIESLRANREHRERIGRFAAERAAERYGWPRIAAETFAVYASVAAGRGMRVNGSRA